MEYTDTVSPQACQDKAVASGGPNPEGSVVCRNGMKIWNGQDMGPGFSLGCLTTTNDPTLMATYGPENTIHTPKPTMASPTIVTENTNSDATTPTDAARGSTSSWNRIALLGLTVILGAFML